jgi:muramoyltetrapeptide carboxypeptidase
VTYARGVISRRDFGRTLALAAGAAAAGSRRAAAGAPALPLLKPPRLAAGDTVGLVLPARMAFEPSRIALAREQLEAIGLRVKVGAHAYARDSYLAGSDEERAADLNAMFADPEVRGIFCFTGGWGSPRVLPRLDFERIRRQPKALIGFSDITALLNAVHQRTGLVTFHGPVADGDLKPWTLEQLRRVVMSPAPIGVLANPPKKDDELVPRAHRILTLRAGRATGKLVGGNLSLVAALMGTPWEIDTRGAILLLEDVHEELYRVDRMLTQLQQGGKLEAAAAVVFGYCSECPPGEGASFSFEQILHHWLKPLGVPAMAGLAFGHLPEKLTLPIGLPATVDAEAGTLTCDQAAVV